MMRDARSFSRMMKHVYTEPKFVAQVEFMDMHPSLSMQIEEQVGRGAMESYVATGQWPDPEQRVTFVRPPAIDFDWWEPRYDQPWRRQAARDREFGALMAGKAA